MGIRILKPFEFDSHMPNFERDVINSNEFENKTPYQMTDAEKESIAKKYDVGHIVWDENTKRHYRLEYSNSTYNFVSVEPFAMKTQEWSTMGNKYIPQLGEIIIFTDYKKVNGVDTPCFKVGDGVNNPTNLPFMSTAYAETSGTSWDTITDVVHHSTKSEFPETGDANTIYIDDEKNKKYRWNGSSYVEI